MNVGNWWLERRPALHRAQDPRRYEPLRIVVLLIFSVALFLAATIGFVWLDLSQDLSERSLDTEQIRRTVSNQSGSEERVNPLAPGEPLNILVLGIDSRKEQAPEFGSVEDVEGIRGDATILVHVSGNRDSMTLVSIPRDLMVEIPNCLLSNGEEVSASFGQVNSAMMLGSGTNYDIAYGVACAQSTVENLTGLQIDNFVVVDFKGFESVVDALGGVWFDVPQDVVDPEANAYLAEGCQLLNGEQALGYARARKSLGDGSDTSRIGRQQELVAALVREVSRKVSSGNLPILVAFVRSVLTVLHVSPQLASFETDLSLLVAVANIPSQNVRLVTMPREPWEKDPNRDQPQEPYASQLWNSLRQDEPFVDEIGYVAGDGRASVAEEPLLDQVESSDGAALEVSPESGVSESLTCPPNGH